MTGASTPASIGPGPSSHNERRTGRPGSRNWPAHLLPYAFFLPAFLVVAAVSFIPLGYAIRQSVHAADYLGMGPFVGLRNFAKFFEGGAGFEVFQRSMLFVAGSVAVAVPLGFGLACALNQPIRYRGLFRTILILPWLVSNLVVALLWAWLLNAQFGPIAHFVGGFGLTMPNAVTSPTLAMPALILANAWHSYPLVMIFVLAALQTVPPELYEAARIDGANGWQRFRLITLPIVRNTTLVVLVLTTLHTFNNVTMVFVMTGGGPAGSTETLALKVFLEEFKYHRTGIASAAAIVIFGLNLLFSLAYIRVLRGPKLQS